MNNPEGRTKILVTHALHFLPQVDYVYTIADGQIMERGTYAELMINDGVFSAFMKEFGSKQEEGDKGVDEVSEGGEGERGHNAVGIPKDEFEQGKTIMQKEERNVGAITWKIYKAYLTAGNGYILVPALLLFLPLMQGTQVMSSYWLVFWQEQQFDKPTWFYVRDVSLLSPLAAHSDIFSQMAVYAALGVSITIAFFAFGAALGLLGYFASKSLHHGAITTTMHAPMSFFETTPLGRIMNRFSKDIDTIDNTITDSSRMFLTTLVNILGSFVLIAVIIPWFLIAVAVAVIAYCTFVLYYGASARELKRLDAILRSSLYAHFSESLAGIATIRAYGETDRFRKESEDRVNIENRFVDTPLQMMYEMLTLLFQGLLADDHESGLVGYTA